MIFNNLKIAITGSLLICGHTLAALITFNTALPVAKGEFVMREQIVVNQSGTDPSLTVQTPPP